MSSMDALFHLPLLPSALGRLAPYPSALRNVLSWSPSTCPVPVARKAKETTTAVPRPTVASIEIYNLRSACSSGNFVTLRDETHHPLMQEIVANPAV